MISVLIVDDDRQFADLVAAKLRKERFEVLVARSGTEAFGLLRDTVPTVILLDLAMPEVDGRQFLGMLRRNVELCMIPVIVLTACDGDECTEAIQQGAMTVLSKMNVSVKQLVDQIKSVAAAGAPD